VGAVFRKSSCCFIVTYIMLMASSRPWDQSGRRGIVSDIVFRREKGSTSGTSLIGILAERTQAYPTAVVVTWFVRRSWSLGDSENDGRAGVTAGRPMRRSEGVLPGKMVRSTATARRSERMASVPRGCAKLAHQAS